MPYDAPERPERMTPEKIIELSGKTDINPRVAERAAELINHHNGFRPEPKKPENKYGVPGPPCSQCQNEWYTYTGTCLTCLSCGHSDSCG